MEKADFIQALETCVAAKAGEFDSQRLPQMLESYRLLHTCAKNLFDLLIKRSLIKEDPYKLEKKITKIETPEMGAFNETETATIMGIRLSDYDTMLDYICGYLSMDTETLTENKIKKLISFNSCIDWANMGINSTAVNTRIVSELISAIRNGAPQMTQRLIIDSLNNAKKALLDVNATLKDLAAFAHEKTKYNVRRLVMENPSFDKTKAEQSGDAERSEIKRMWQAGMGKMPYNNDIVMEIVKEDHGPNAEQLQQVVLSSLKASVVAKKTEKAKADPKLLLVDAAAILAAAAPQMAQVLQKIGANHDVLQADKATLLEKFKTALRHALGMKDPPEEYVLTITNHKTQAQTTRRIDYNEFYNALAKRMKVYALISNHESPQHARIAASPPTSLYSFVTKQLNEMQDLLIVLEALDEYFKTSKMRGDKSRIKGLKIELATLSNCVVKARGRCADFASEAEEAKAMQKLGVGKNAAPSTGGNE